MTCSDCNGTGLYTGFLVSEPCRTCGGPKPVPCTPGAALALSGAGDSGDFAPRSPGVMGQEGAAITRPAGWETQRKQQLARQEALVAQALADYIAQCCGEYACKPGPAKYLDACAEFIVRVPDPHRSIGRRFIAPWCTISGWVGVHAAVHVAAEWVATNFRRNFTRGPRGAWMESVSIRDKHAPGGWFVFRTFPCPHDEEGGPPE